MNILKYAKKFSFLAAAMAMLQVGTVSADPADDLKAVLEKGVYTIRYENVTPPNQNEIMKGKTRLVQSGSWYQSFETESDFEDPYARYYVITGVATSDGTNRYYEYSVDREDDTTDENFEYANCSLTLGDELFTFKRTQDRHGRTEYVGNKGKNKVVAQLPYYNTLGYPIINFGNFAVTELLNAIIFDEQKPEGSILYEKVDAGINFEGLDFVDYIAKNPAEDMILNAIRYYFKGGKLVKIHAGRYNRDGDKIRGYRIIINITEFKTTAETDLLRLPDEIKDATKRKDDDKD